MRRETAGAYLKAAGIAVRRPVAGGRAAKPANEVITDSEPAPVNLDNGQVAKPAMR